MSKRKTIPRPEIIWRLVPSNEVCKQLGISYSTLKRWRKAGTIIEGIHYGFLPGSRTNILWNLDLMRCFIQNSGTTAHARSIGLSHRYQIPVLILHPQLKREHTYNFCRVVGVPLAYPGGWIRL